VKTDAAIFEWKTCSLPEVRRRIVPCSCLRTLCHRLGVKLSAQAYAYYQAMTTGNVEQHFHVIYPELRLKPLFARKSNPSCPRGVNASRPSLLGLVARLVLTGGYGPARSRERPSGGGKSPVGAIGRVPRENIYLMWQLTYRRTYKSVLFRLEMSNIL